jgi:2-methylcitrate dehydratase PrpD
MAGETLATRLAEWVVALDYEPLSPRAIEVAKLLVLDQLGLQLRGSTLASVQPPRRLVEAMGAAPQSTLVGSAKRTAAPYAAYVNGTLASSIEFDDAHMAAWHIGSYVVPSALAFGELTGASGREVITAIAAGAQVMALLGAETRPAMLRDGWHGAKILGTFGAAAAVGKLLGLTAGRLAHAFAIAGSDAGGTMEYEASGGEVKRLHAGSAGRTGSQAALLAKDDFTGPLTIFEGERGLFRLFGDTRDVSGIDGRWDHFHLVDTMFRLYPVVGTAAPVLDAVRQVWTTELNWRDVEEIRLGLPAYAIGHGAAVTRPANTVSAQFSTAFSVALMLVRGRNRPEDYSNPVLWIDPDLLSVVDRIVPYAHVFVPEQPTLSCRLDITLTDGRVLSHTQRGFRGHPDNPDTDDEDVETKFLDNVDGVVEPSVAREIVELAGALDKLDDVTGLMRLTAGSGHR